MEGVLTAGRVGAVGGFRLSAADAARFTEVQSDYEAEQFHQLTNPLEAEFKERLFAADFIVERQEVERQARELIANRKHIEIAYKTKKTYYDDARTLIFEALTASGHLSVVETTGTLAEIHAGMVSVVLNSYSDTLPEHEKRRRFQELCEELTLQATEIKIADGRLPQDTEIATISDYIMPGTLSEKSAQAIGYRSYNKKGMVRSSRLRDNGNGTYTRISEQVSRSNADALRTQAFLHSQGVPVRAAEHADVSVLGTQLLHEMHSGVVGILQRLDQHQGPEIRYGEPMHDSQLPYEDLRQASAERERVAHCYIEKLANFIQVLDHQKTIGTINERQYQAQFNAEVATILRAICVMDPGYAVGCFGKQAEAGFIQASNYVLQGNLTAAATVLINNRSLEQTVSFCGGSLSQDKAKKLGLEVDSLEDLLNLGKEKWSSKRGACRVENCPSPRPTEVGGCSVCLDGCQKLFDKGWSYERIVDFYARLNKTAKKVIQKTAQTGRAATKKQNPARKAWPKGTAIPKNMRP